MRRTAFPCENPTDFSFLRPLERNKHPNSPSNHLKSVNNVKHVVPSRSDIMKKSLHAAAILALTLLPLSCAAYDAQLSAAAIHEAYVLGAAQR